MGVSAYVPTFKHGKCEHAACGNEAIYRVLEKRLCKDHKGRDTVFAPFLGQQEKFFQRRERVVFFGGAGGCGKSLCLQIKFGQQLALENRRFEEAKKRGVKFQSKAWGVYLRRTSPDFKQAVQRSREFFEAMDPAAHYNQNDHTWTFPSCGGAIFEFAHCEHEGDRFKYKSREWTYIGLDESSEFTEVQADYFDTRLRTTDPELEPYLQYCMASNPDGPHMLWVRDRFIEIAPPETVVRIETTLRDGRVMEYDQINIPGKLDDNPLLMESGTYEATLMNKRPEVREAILMGNWYISAGAFLANTWQQDMHVCENHDIPPGATVFRSADWGINNPSSIGWWYEDADGGLTMFAHLRTVGLTVDKVAEKMRAMEERFGFWNDEDEQSGLNFARNPLDTACFGAGQGLVGARTIAKDFKSQGFRWTPAKKGPGSRMLAASQIILRMNTYIPAAFNGATHPAERERPMMRFMERCVSPIKTLPALQTDKANIDDVDTEGDDHDWDCVQYAVLHNPIKMPEAGADDELEDDDNFSVPTRSRKRAGLGEGPWMR